MIYEIRYMVYKTEKRGNKMIILYSTGCPQCNVLKEKLETANIAYIEVSDTNTIISKGITKVPVLEVNGTQMGLSEANKWIKSRSEE